MLNSGKARVHGSGKRFDIAAAKLLGNERGMALILAMVMLVVVTIMGVWALDTSSTDLKISGNLRTSVNAYYLSEAAFTYGSNDDVLKDDACPHLQLCSSSPTATYDVWPAPEIPITYNGISGSIQSSFRLATKDSIPLGEIYDSDLSLTSSGQSVGKFYSIYWVIDTEGKLGDNSAIALQGYIVQIIPGETGN